MKSKIGELLKMPALKRVSYTFGRLHKFVEFDKFVFENNKHNI